jgi:hypothetical protein
MNQYFKDLPQWAKGTIAVAGLLGIGFIAYKLYKFASNLQETQDLKDVVSESRDEYDKLKKKDTLTAPISAYSSLANDIKIKLNGCEMATTEADVIIAITKIVKKPIDWYYLVKVFGVRDVDDCGYGSTKYNLTELLKDQLDTVLDYYNIPLVGSGIAKNSYIVLEKYLQKIGVTI